jgi:negative regulator of replication initiation
VGDLTEERDGLISALKDKEEELLRVIASHDQNIQNLNADVLQKTLKVQELDGELKQALAAKESLGEERIWFVRRGLDMAYRKTRASNEFTCP